MKLERVISGGQTGADRAGLIAARAAGIATGGWMPKGFRALDGTHPEFAALYSIREHTSDRYPPRTALNVKDSDATIRFATNWDSPGERLTLELCERYGRPHFEVTPGDSTTSADVADWIKRTGVRVLNVAGNSARMSPGIEAFAITFLTEVFQLLRDAG